MSADVEAMADQLRQFATHFEMRDWNYARDLGGLTSLRYDRHEDTVRGRLRSAVRWLTRRRQPWESAFNDAYGARIATEARP